MVSNCLHGWLVGLTSQTRKVGFSANCFSEKLMKSYMEHIKHKNLFSVVKSEWPDQFVQVMFWNKAGKVILSQLILFYLPFLQN